MSVETMTMKMRGRPVTLAEAMESARRLVNSHFHNLESARCSIPADVRDNDIVLTDYLVERQNEHKFLSKKFLDSMNDIGAYGFEKYGVDSFQHRMSVGDKSRWMERVTSEAIGEHVSEHYAMHLRGDVHDHFNTRRHQLAAVAFNAMMEFYLSGLEDEVPQ